MFIALTLNDRPTPTGPTGLQIEARNSEFAQRRSESKNTAMAAGELNMASRKRQRPEP
jgi:hypothetical protein